MNCPHGLRDPIKTVCAKCHESSIALQRELVEALIRLHRMVPCYGTGCPDKALITRVEAAL